MCQDSTSPDPGRFCCMRGWSITVMVFGIFEILFGGFQIPTLLSPTCYTCPRTRSITRSSPATPAACHQCSRTSTRSAPRMASAPPQTARPRAAPPTRHTRAARRTSSCSRHARGDVCTEWQGYYADVCSIAGDAPPDGQATTIVQMAGLFIGGLLKVIAGAVLSARASPTRGR